MKELTIKLKMLVKEHDPDLLDKIASRIYTIEGVEDVTAKLKKTNEQQTQQAGTSVFSKSQGIRVQHL
jgi:hypothetical protein